MKTAKKMALLLGMIVMALSLKAETDLPDITLPAPRMEGGKPLMAALKDRQTSRAYSAKPLPLQMLSDLLWAADGVNRADSGKRTAPSTRNWQEVDLYVVLPAGSYIYDARTNMLRAVAKGDLRQQTGTQEFAATAPLDLVFVADISKMKGTSADDVALYYGANTGFISQNIYLYCASEGLATVVRGSLDRAALAKALNLPEQRKIVFAQTVGYPTPDGK